MRKYINQLRDNEAIKEIYQVTEIQLRPNKNGNLYLQFSLADKTGTIGGRLWNVMEDMYHQFAPNDYVEAEGTVQRFQGALQFIAKKLKKVDAATVDEEEFRRFRAIDTTQLVVELKELVKSIKQPDLRNLCDCILFDEELMARFCAAPAGVKLHHAY
ncbi:MAG: OB-fold nucleic acid binding domain-containing protein, partial [Thermoguttaceae bacterium]